MNILESEADRNVCVYIYCTLAHQIDVHSIICGPSMKSRTPGIAFFLLAYSE